MTNFITILLTAITVIAWVCFIFTDISIFIPLAGNIIIYLVVHKKQLKL